MNLDLEEAEGSNKNVLDETWSAWLRLRRKRKETL